MPTGVPAEIVTKICPACNKEFSHSNEAKAKNRRFCSKQCIGIFRQSEFQIMFQAMDVWKCCKCKEQKPKSEFYKSKSTPTGLSQCCKICTKQEMNSKHYESQMYGEKACSKCGVTKHITKFDKKPTQSDGRSSQCRECINDRINNRKQTDVNFRLSILCRNRLWCAVRADSAVKSDTTRNLVGCTTEELKHHIQNQFTDGMTWDKLINGEIHLDHILPCISFNLLDDAEQRKCFHYTNLQPLWAADNLKKRDKILYNMIWHDDTGWENLGLLSEGK